MPDGRTEPRAAYALIRDELLLDGNAPEPRDLLHDLGRGRGVGVRAFAVTQKDFIGRTLSQLADDFPAVPILRVVRGGEILDMLGDLTVQETDLVTVRADVEDLMGREIKLIGPESDDPLTRNVPIEVADGHVGSRKISGKRLAELGVELSGGVTVQAGRSAFDGARARLRAGISFAQAAPIPASAAACLIADRGMARSFRTGPADAGQRAGTADVLR